MNCTSTFPFRWLYTASSYIKIKAQPCFVYRLLPVWHDLQYRKQLVHVAALFPFPVHSKTLEPILSPLYRLIPQLLALIFHFFIVFVNTGIFLTESLIKNWSNRWSLIASFSDRIFLVLYYPFAGISTRNITLIPLFSLSFNL